MKKYSLIICLLLCLTVLCSCATKQDIDTSSGIVNTITEKDDTSTVTTPDVLEDKEPTQTQKEPSQAQESVEDGKEQQTEDNKAVTNQKPTEETIKKEEPKKELPDTSESTVVSKPTTKPTEETTSKPTETEPPKETTESTVPEIVRPTGVEVAQRVVYYINQHRETQGSAKLTVLSGMTKVAEYRSNQLITNFAHSAEDQRKAYAKYKYGEYVDMTEFGLPESSNYYTAYCGEAIAKGRWSGTADDIAKKIADGFRNSSGHWNYVGSADNSYIAVGCVYNASSGYWYCCVLVNNVNYG